MRNIKELLNKRIEDLELRDKTKRTKEIIFRMFKEKKLKNSKTINEQLKAEDDSM